MRKAHLQRHEECVHGGESAKKYVCPVEECGKAFSLPHQAKRHDSLHQKHIPAPAVPKPTLFKCLEVGCEEVVYKNEKNMKRHQKLEHSGQTFVCGAADCTFTTTKWSLLQLHKRESHQKRKRPIEDADIGTKHFQCNVSDCQKSFSRKSAVNVHIKTVHQDLRPFECRLCQSAFGHKHLLARHLQSVHGATSHDE